VCLRCSTIPDKKEDDKTNADNANRDDNSDDYANNSTRHWNTGSCPQVKHSNESLHCDYATVKVLIWFIKTCIARLLLSITHILRAALIKFRVYVCVCNYSSQTTEPICIKIIPANTASYADCYRLLRFEIFTPTIFKTPQKHISGAP